MDEIKPIHLVEKDPILESKVMEASTPMEPKPKSLLLPLLIIGIALGIGTGYFMAQRNLSLSVKPGSSTGLIQNPTSASSVKVGDTFGTNDTTTFTDQTDGILQAGGIGGEGTHHLVRGANATQWVYLTSSVVDLDMFIGDQVSVWGQTNHGKKAGWLMDVGKLKVTQLNAAPVDTGSAVPGQD
jgi:hypothetical protein